MNVSLSRVQEDLNKFGWSVTEVNEDYLFIASPNCYRHNRSMEWCVNRAGEIFVDVKYNIRESNLTANMVPFDAELINEHVVICNAVIGARE